MIRATSDARLTQPPEEVFDFLAATEHHAVWNPEARSVEQVTPGPPGPGTRLTGDYEHVGRIDTEISEFDRPHMLEFHSNGKQAEMRLRFTLMPDADGTAMHVDGSLQLKGALRFMEGAIRGAVQKQYAARAAAVKDALDGRG